MEVINKLSSSLRNRTAEESLVIAKSIAANYGVTRVTDTTYLDKIGIPVYASIRPKAKTGTLCVNAGKGLRHVEAEIGAYMEAIEFSCAENWSNPLIKQKTFLAKELANKIQYSLIDLGLRYGKKIELERDILSSEAKDLKSGKNTLVPSECVFLPAPSNVGQQIFGSSSNGLASGNNIEEATLHAIFEIIERDINSFNNIKDMSVAVNKENLPDHILSLIQKIEIAGLEVAIRYTENEFKIPFYQAYVLERIPSSPVSISVGVGCHFLSDISLVRALTEAAQSRLSHIHGGRDDIIDRVKYFNNVGRDVELKYINASRKAILNEDNSKKFSDIPNLQLLGSSISEFLNSLVSYLDSLGFKIILSVLFTSPKNQMQVVKVIIPKMEAYNHITKKVGERLRDFVKREM